MVMAATQQHKYHVQTYDDGSLKRRTDCVYFLVSSRNCKKGTLCEYRHCENAQLNPEDCKYWLNGNCLNPECPYRHLPLDNSVGMQTATSVAKIGTHITKNCTFFQKGQCLRGNKCAFSHELSFVSYKFLHAPTTAPASDCLHLKNPFGGHVRCTHAEKRHQNYISESAEKSNAANLPMETGACLMTRSPKQLYESELRQRLLEQKDRQMETVSSLMKELELRQRVRMQWERLLIMRGCHMTSCLKQLEESMGSTHGTGGDLMTSNPDQLEESVGSTEMDSRTERASLLMKELELRRRVRIQWDSLMKLRGCLMTSSPEVLDESVGSTHGNEGCLVPISPGELYESEMPERLLKQRDQQLEMKSSIMSRCPEQMEESGLRHRLLKRRRVDVLRSMPAVF